MGTWLGRAFSSLIVVVALAATAPSAYAQDGDVFLLVSLEDVFDTDIAGEDNGSPLIIVRIGSLTGDVPSPEETHFIPEDPPPEIPLPTGEFELSDLDGNESTIFGSFTVTEFEDSEPHLVTPGAGDIDPLIQAAVFMASADIAEAAAEEPFTSTAAIAAMVAFYLPEGSEISISDVAEAIFGSTTPLDVPEPPPGSSPSCEAEGELFPHEPGDPLFTFELSFDETGELSTLDICLIVVAEVKENSVNLKKKGNVSIAIYESDAFDVDDIDEATVEIDGVFADNVQIAANKATCQFSVQELFDADVLTSSTTEVTIKATLSDGSCIEGTAAISVK